ncbi:DMT family transporter [Terrabacter sp. BE26]|uniref:DMT family transporter n=1 Tax=Terrabacter sp. BE26 TaxID=2898152 RepID=UPI0035BE765D
MPERVIPGPAESVVRPPAVAPATAQGPTSSTRRPSLPWQAKFGALALIWGSSFLLMKYALHWFAPIQIATGRILFGAVTVTLLLHVVGGRLPRSRRVWAHLLVVGLLLASLPFTLFPLGEERVASALAGIGNATTPMVTVLATAAMLPAERLPGRKIVAVGVGFLGVLVIAQPWQASGRPDLVGFGFTLVAGASYGIGWTWVRTHLAKEDLGGLQLPAALLVVASAEMLVVLLAWWALHRSAFAAPWSSVTGATGGWAQPVLSLLALGVLGTGVAYLLQFDVVRAVGQQVGSLVTYVIPIVSVVLGYLLLGERLGVWQLVGAALVLGAAVFVAGPNRRASRPA